MATLRLPTAPYPGLRPFLDHEDMLMHGRQAQVEDVVRRLGRPLHPAGDEPAMPARFVALIGGSGSGKSSLIRAGVVPFLRQYGIPEAGDLWESVVATPGTNFQPDADGQLHESPITRLAAKFEHVLRGGQGGERAEAIAQTLRRPGGLGLLVDLYGADLDLPAGVQAETACVLVVIDQFEELFHKSNAGSADARVLVERVIDHYHQAKNGKGSPRCFLAITLRSEHLNDCAGYLGLPEAINTGGYLVSRLDDTQVREVIEKPAQRYLRLRQRERQTLARQTPPVDTSGLPPLPAAVQFERGVVERLIDDTRQIAHDPDHLPLLQHALARLWGVACAREGLTPSDVPAAITLADLWRAGQAGDLGPATDPGQNLLRLSLDRWAEQALQAHPEAERTQVLDLLRRLAYKDSRTGTYNQQRLYVAGHALGTAGLHALIRGRWIDGVDYLHWDDDDPQRVTLKVSHEAFIRGWATLRRLADREAWRLEQFITLLAATRRWVELDRSADELLEPRLLGLLADADIAAALGPDDAGRDPDAPNPVWRDWLAWLGQLPQGAALQSVPCAEVRHFYRRSLQAQETVLRRRHRRVRRVIGSLAAVAACGLAGAAYALFVQAPVDARSRLLFDAATLANQASLRNTYAEIGSSHLELEALLMAASQLERARHGEGVRFAALSDALLASPWSPLRALSLAQLLPDATRTVEPTVNGKLRTVLARSVWRTANVLPDTDRIDNAGTAPLRDIRCDGLTGTLIPADEAAQTNRPRRGVFVAGGGTPGGDVLNHLMFSATVHPVAGCQRGRQVAALPLERRPAVLFDALMGHMLLVLDGGAYGGPATVSISRLRWDDSQAGGSAEVLPPLAVVASDAIADAVRQQVPLGVGMASATWRMPGGRALRVGDEVWRLVSANLQRLVPQPEPTSLRPLDDGSTDAACAAVADAVRTESDRPGVGGPAHTPVAARVQVFRDGDTCLAQLRLPVVAAAGTGLDSGRDSVQWRAYARPGPQALDATGRLSAPAVPVAIVDAGRLGTSDRRWLVGRPGTDLEGWLVLERNVAGTGRLRYAGVPWSTGALLQLGAQVLKGHQAVELAAGRGLATNGAPAAAEALGY